MRFITTKLFIDSCIRRNDEVSGHQRPPMADEAQPCLPTRQGNSGISFLVVYTQRDFQGNLQLQAKILPCFSASLDNLDFILERKTSGVFDLSHLDLNSAVSFTSSIKSNNLGSKLICMGNYTRN